MMKLADKEKQAAKTSLALLYHVSRELSSALDLHTVLERVLVLSQQYVGATSASMLVFDEGGKPVEGVIAIGDQIFPDMIDQLMSTFQHGLAGWVAQNRQAVLIPDTSQDPRWLRRADDLPSQTGAKSAVCAPLLARDQLIGVMTLVHPDPYSLSEDQLALFQVIADQAGIAVLNARLYAESQRRERVMTAVAESAMVINGSLDVNEVLANILQQTIQALQVDVVSLALLDSSKQYLDYVASTAREEDSVVGQRIPVKKGVAGWVARNGQGVVVPSVSKDKRFYSRIDRQTGYDTRAMVCAPIRSGGEVIGVLSAINPRQESFGPDALLVLNGVASLAGTAVQHAQLFERLQTAHQRYHDLFEDSMDMILITDWEGKVLESNRQAREMIHGVGEQDGSKPFHVADLNIVHLDRLGEQFENLKTGETIDYEGVVRFSGHSEIPVQVYVRQVNIDGAAFVQWMLRDITERKNLDVMRNDLISMIYHDLRSPLANIVSSLDVVASVMPNHSEQDLQPLLQIAARSTERIQRLTNSLLDINWLEAGQPVGNRQVAPPVELAHDAVEAIYSTARSKEIEILCDLPHGLAPVYVDPEMIRRVLINLLENAIKYTPTRGKIQVHARQEEGFIHFFVSDNGPGIPAESQAMIFDKFARLNAKGDQRGFGLGLAYCQLAVLGHGGKIWVESAPNQGASFHFTLPVYNDSSDVSG